MYSSTIYYISLMFGGKWVMIIYDDLVKRPLENPISEIDSPLFFSMTLTKITFLFSCKLKDNVNT